MFFLNCAASNVGILILDVALGLERDSIQLV
jgi:hypothetical protein